MAEVNYREFISPVLKAFDSSITQLESERKAATAERDQHTLDAAIRGLRVAKAVTQASCPTVFETLPFRDKAV